MVDTPNAASGERSAAAGAVGVGDETIDVNDPLGTLTSLIRFDRHGAGTQWRPHYRVPSGRSSLAFVVPSCPLVGGLCRRPAGIRARALVEREQ